MYVVFESDENECGWRPAVCGSEHQCIDVIGSFRCQPCSDEDAACGTGPCDPNPCRHGGRCQSAPDSQFHCVCRPGFSGSLCEFRTAPPPPPTVTEHCQPGGCLNGGSCEVTADRVARCRCVPPWVGRRCQVNIAL